MIDVTLIRRMLKRSEACDASKGFTLFETLVVLVITGLIATVLVQSMGTVLASRNAVAAKIVDLDRVVVERNLMLEPLRGVVPDQNRIAPQQFRGEVKSLNALTVTPLQKPTGTPTKFRMYFNYDSSAAMTALMYQEDGGEPVELTRWTGDQGAFSYRDRDGAWSRLWPPARGTPPPTPWLVRIETGQDFPPTAIAFVAGPHDPIVRLEDMLGAPRQ